MLSRRRFFLASLTLAAVTAGLALPALAQTAESLRASGAAGERFDGYMEARDGSARGAVTAINAERRRVYEQRAAQDGVSPDQVGRVYAKQIYQRLPTGAWFKAENGQWSQK
jgi:uncharacterized protein YdbL (DUF1318 family)